MPHRIPYAVSNFEELIEEGYYFVDKTAYVRQLEQYKVPVFLRPRRFGKSLWCSMLECYYDVNRREKFDRLFGTLAIGQDPTPERNSYLVMRFDFSKIEVRADYEELRKNFDGECANSFSRFVHSYQELLGECDIDPKAHASACLAGILTQVANRRLPPVYLIIDEYDNFANQLITTHQDALYREITTSDSFLRAFFKVIKAGIGDRTVGRTFITGVLPITMDDLTSGFNIAEIVTLAPKLLAMLGFTQAEVDRYVETVFADYHIDSQLKPQIISVLREFYNGYAFAVDMTDRLYNSTIISYFFKYFVMNDGKMPTDFIDDNLRTDVSWIQRLASGEQPALAILERILLENTLAYDEGILVSKFNITQFFDREFYPISLFYLGMLTIQDRFQMSIPNQTMRKIFAGYFNTLSHIEVTQGYTPYFQQFVTDLDLGNLFAGYWEVYIGQLPAQLFEKMNENFFRTTFFELCSRYLSRDFSFGVEVNHPSGRSDFEMLGKPDSVFAREKFVVEFKYTPVREEATCRWLQLPAPLQADVAQVTAYAADIKREFPNSPCAATLSISWGGRDIGCSRWMPSYSLRSGRGGPATAIRREGINKSRLSWNGSSHLEFIVSPDDRCQVRSMTPISKRNSSANLTTSVLPLLSFSMRSRKIHRVIHAGAFVMRMG